MVIPSKLETSQRCLFSTLLFNTVLEILTSAIRQKIKIKGLQNGKEVKFFLFTESTIVYIKNPDISKINISTN